MTGYYKSDLYGIFVQAILYGIYVTTLAHCLRWLLFDDEGWKLRKRINWPLLVISILLLLLSTTDLALTLINYDVLLTESAVLKYIDIYNAMEGATVLIVDGVLIYRLWIVYDKSWRITCLPIVLWLGCLACLILVNFFDISEFAGILRRLHIIITFFSCNIVINLYATTLIVYRILRAAHDIKTIGRVRHLYRATRVIAESGILYTLTSILHLVAVGRNLSDTLGDVGRSMNFSMAGIAFNLILIRVGQNRNAGDVDESRLGTRRVTKEGQLSTLQFIPPSAMSQDRSLAILEEGIQAKV